MQASVSSATLILTRSDIRSLLDYESCIAAVESAFRLEAEGSTVRASILGVHLPGGGIHVKAAGMHGDRFYYAVKINANFPSNLSSHGLPTIQGVLSLHDASDGRLLALMDSMEVTSIRTAAATAVAAKYLARPDSRTVTMIGCGMQGRSQLRALSKVLNIEKVFAYDSNYSVAESYAVEMPRELDCDVAPVSDYRSISGESDVIVTCTPSREPLLTTLDVAPGTFIAAVGADSDTKHEIAPDLMRAAAVVADNIEQCATIGDLHHALEAGLMTRDNVCADLARLVSGRTRGRRSTDEITIFDSTGTALEDVAAAALVYERALSRAGGFEIDFGK